MPEPGPPLWDDLLQQAPWLRRYTRHLAGAAAQADDWEQEAWLAALRRAPQRRGLWPWLRTVVRRAAAAEQRRSARRQRRESCAAGGDTAPAASEQAAGQEVRHLLQDCLAELPASDRELLHLRYFEQASVAELAQRLQLGERAVETRLRRAKKRLEARLQARCNGGARELLRGLGLGRALARLRRGWAAHAAVAAIGVLVLALTLQDGLRPATPISHPLPPFAAAALADPVPGFGAAPAERTPVAAAPAVDPSSAPASRSAKSSTAEPAERASWFFLRLTAAEAPNRPIAAALATYVVDGLEAGSCGSDQDGLLPIRYSAGTDCVIHVLAPGRQPLYLAPLAGHATAETAFQLELQPAATLQGHLLGAAGAELEARTSRMALAHPVAQPAKFLQGTTSWTAVVGADGAYALTGLPPSIALVLRLRRPDGRMISIPERPQLQPGEERRFDRDLERLSTVAGRITDESGTPRVDLRIGLFPPEALFSARDRPAASATCFELQLYSLPPEERRLPVEVDPQGGFTLPDVLAGRWVLVAAEARHAGRVYGTWLEVPEAAAGETVCCQVTIPSPAGLHGHVLLPDGTPAAHARVLLWNRAELPVRIVDCDVLGRFEMPRPLQPGQLRAQLDGSNYLESDPWPTEGGTDYCVLRLVEAARMRVRPRAPELADGERVTILVQHAESNLCRQFEASLGEVAELDTLRPGTHHLTLATASGWAAHYPGLLAAAEPEPIEVSLHPAGTLLISGVDFPQAIGVRLRRDRLLIGSYAMSSRSDLRICLPPGSYTIELLSAGEAPPPIQAICRLGQATQVEPAPR